MIPGETREDVEDEMKSLIQSLKEEDPKFKADYEITFFREPMEISPDEEICQVLKQGSLEVLGKEPQWVGAAAGWTPR